MKKWAYVIIPTLAVLGPLVLSFDQKVNFIQYWLPWLISTVVVGIPYLIWDSLVVKQDHWQFNSEFVGTWRLFRLPLGEYLFFLFIPYACIFLYEVGIAYFGNTPILPWNLWWSLGALAASLAALLLLRKKGYTVLALGSVAAFFALQGALLPELPGTFGFLFFIGFSTLGFLVVDGLYTSLPTIYYNPASNTGVRVFTIPLEDFLYNLSHLGLILVVYLLCKAALGLGV